MAAALNKEMYSEEILDLYKNPDNMGCLTDPTHVCRRTNPLCGDEVRIELEVKNGIIKDVKFQSSGCVLSVVSASLLTSKIKGMAVADVENLGRSDIEKMFEVSIRPVRLKCVLLPLDAILQALKSATADEKTS